MEVSRETNPEDAGEQATPGWQNHYRHRPGEKQAPGSLIPTPESQLDFGLAKALEPEVSEADAANSPTMTDAATRAGIIMGGGVYEPGMFGGVLGEMLTGHQSAQRGVGKMTYSIDEFLVCKPSCTQRAP